MLLNMFGHAGQPGGSTALEFVVLSVFSCHMRQKIILEKQCVGGKVSIQNRLDNLGI